MVNQEFAGQQVGEKVDFIFRRHFSVMFRGIAISIVILILSLIPLIIWGNLAYLWYVALAGVALAGLITFNTWLKWYYSIYIVTNLRVRQQIQANLFRKTAIDLYLNKVQNISYNIAGLRGSLMGYGTIVLQTIVGDMVMTKIADCEKIYNQLSIAVQTVAGQSEQGEYGDEEIDG